MIKSYLKNSIDTQTLMLNDVELIKTMENITDKVIETLKNGNKLLFIGNGGSASDSNHLATEFVSRFLKERHAFNAISLCANNSVITALSNDYGYDKVFSRQIEAIGKSGDVVFALSTSGNSKNILEALKISKEMNICTIGLTRKSKTMMDVYCDLLVKIPSDEVPIIQEAQMLLGHIICKVVEELIYT